MQSYDKLCQRNTFEKETFIWQRKMLQWDQIGPNDSRHADVRTHEHSLVL